jgi:protocatechuate 4,5-dioxygenase, beta chain
MPTVEYVQEAGSKGIEPVMWVIARGAPADIVDRPRRKVAHRFSEVPASKTAVGPSFRNTRHQSGITEDH